MVYCNLAVLLAERRLKISALSADTGISRTTLTALCQNAGKGVQLDTINSLCMYLNVSVGELFTFYPFDVTLTDCSYWHCNKTAELTFSYVSKQLTTTVCYLAEIEVMEPEYPDKIHTLQVNLCASDPETPKEKHAHELLINAFQSLPIPFMDSLKAQIANALIQKLAHQTSVEVDGEFYGYPEDPSFWEASVDFPAY